MHTTEGYIYNPVKVENSEDGYMVQHEEADRGVLYADIFSADRGSAFMCDGDVVVERRDETKTDIFTVIYTDVIVVESNET